LARSLGERLVKLSGICPGVREIALATARRLGQHHPLGSTAVALFVVILGPSCMAVHVVLD